MRSQNDKATWSILRFDHRTFTAQLARMQKVKPVTEIPDKYNYRQGGFCKLPVPQAGDISANFSGDKGGGFC